MAHSSQYSHQLRHGLGVGAPSAISRDLRSAPTTSARTAKTSSSSSPIVESSDGQLSKVYGSLVEPESKQQQWACLGCSQVFHRDATIYIAPLPTASSGPLGPSSVVNRERLLQGGSQDHYCRKCYEERFSLGICVACTKPVVGTTKEDGKFVKASNGDYWHGRCWKCVGCDERETDKVSLGMTGLPTCEECFDKSPPRRRHVPCENLEPRGRQLALSQGSRSVMSGRAGSTQMGATIAELSMKFGKPVPSRTIPQSPIRQQSPERRSPERLSHSRSNSLTGSTRLRPLTAQFSGQSFNLAAFQPSTPTLSRSDSRSRSVSPHKTNPTASRKEPQCAKCFAGPFDGPYANAMEATMIAISRARLHFHPGCFECAICSKTMNESTRSFVRLEEGRYAHPACAPPELAARREASSLTAPNATMMSRASSSTSISDHATHQRETRPSLSVDTSPVLLPTSYLSPPSSNDKAERSTSPTYHAPRRFQSSAGAAPPTTSTLQQQRPSTSGPGNMASLAVSSPGVQASGRFAKLGGMQSCGGCSLSVSTLEGVAGPRGMRWHKKCLVCTSKSRRGDKPCGKALDSSARVNGDGQIRCRQCFDFEHSPHVLR